MRLSLLLAACSVLAVSACNQATRTAQESSSTPLAAASVMNVTTDVGCAMCVYDMPGVTSCSLAAVIDGQPKLVSGAEAILHAHGLCSGAKPAVVSGTVKGDEFVATTIEIK